MLVFGYILNLCLQFGYPAWGRGTPFPAFFLPCPTNYNLQFGSSCGALVTPVDVALVTSVDDLYLMHDTLE